MKRASRMRRSAAPEANALRSRGCPNPDNAPVRSRPVAVLRAEREVKAYKRQEYEARMRMHKAQDLVRELKGAGKPYADEAKASREARHAWLSLTGGTVRKTVDVDQGASSNPVKAT